MYDLLHGTKLLKHVFLIWVLDSYVCMYIFVCFHFMSQYIPTCFVFLHFSHPKL